ncbi:GHMP kinase [Amanita rubescens]|nr:GHMP kinase [Amanita rubescens]
MPPETACAHPQRPPCMLSHPETARAGRVTSKRDITAFWTIPSLPELMNTPYPLICRFAGEKDETEPRNSRSRYHKARCPKTQTPTRRRRTNDGINDLDVWTCSARIRPGLPLLDRRRNDGLSTLHPSETRPLRIPTRTPISKNLLDAFSSPPGSSVAAVLESLGNLMNESQRNCSSLFHCSCPELDKLVFLSIQAGAFGSRLTDAGWGGCTVSLVAEDRGLEGEDLNQVIFATKPSSGACVYKFA